MAFGSLGYILVRADQFAECRGAQQNGQQESCTSLSFCWHEVFVRSLSALVCFDADQLQRRSSKCFEYPFAGAQGAGECNCCAAAIGLRRVLRRSLECEPWGLGGGEVERMRIPYVWSPSLRLVCRI